MQELQDPPKAIDWEYIQALYLQGVGPKEIARKTGVKADTISVRATRHGWTGTLRRTGGPRQDAIEPSQGEQADSGESGALSRASTKARQSLSDEVLRAVATLGDTKHSKRLESQRERAGVVQILASAAKTVFGWSEGQQSPAVRIQVLGSLRVMPDERPVIDVSPVPELPEST